MKLDLHNHTKRCNHAQGEYAEYVDVAIKNGIDIFGFACHAPMAFDEAYRMSVDDIQDYLSEIRALKTQYKNIDIRVGFEVDYINGKEYLIEQAVLQSDVDYLIGSVHFLDDWGFDNPEFINQYDMLNMDMVWIDYLQSLTNMAKSGLFDIVGHFDLLKIFHHKPSKHVEKYIQETLYAIRDARMVLEINTAGLRKPIQEIYPSEDILRLAYEIGIEITFSSDAHAPHQVAFMQERARKMAKDIGYKHAVAFNKRQKEIYEI